MTKYLKRLALVGLVYTSHVFVVLSDTCANDVHLLDAAKQGWRSAATAAENCKGTVEVVRTNRETHRLSYVYKVLHDAALHHFIKNPGESPREERVVCSNPDYAFRLSRRLETDPWVVTYIGSTTPRIEEALDSDALVLAQYGLYIEGQYLPELIEKPGVTVQSFVAEQSSDDTIVVLDLKCHGVQHGDTDWWVRTASIVLDRDRNWMIRNYEVKASQNNKESDIHAVYTYAEASDGVPKLVSVRRSTSRAVVEHIFNKVSFGNVSEAEFTLGFYGLEYGGLKNSPEGMSLPLVILNVGVIVALLAILLKKWSRASRIRG